jgi:hypothetical protein
MVILIMMARGAMAVGTADVEAAVQGALLQGVAAVAVIKLVA